MADNTFSTAMQSVGSTTGTDSAAGSGVEELPLTFTSTEEATGGDEQSDTDVGDGE